MAGFNEARAKLPDCGFHRPKYGPLPFVFPFKGSGHISGIFVQMFLCDSCYGEVPLSPENQAGYGNDKACT